jgi:hypothetical protein
MIRPVFISSMPRLIIMTCQTRFRHILIDPPTRRNLDATTGPVKRKVRKLRIKRPELAKCFSSC